MKKYLILFLALLFIPQNVYSAEREMTVSVATSTGLVVAGEAALYGYSMVATANAGSVGLYDNLTNSRTESDIKSEHQEATAYNSKPYIPFDEPILFDNGLYAEINDADVMLYYKK